MKKILILVGIIIIAGFVLLMMRHTGSAVTPTKTTNTGGDTKVTGNVDRGAEFTSHSNNPIAFSTKGLDVKIDRAEERTGDLVTYLADHHTSCGPSDRPANYYQQLVQTYAAVNKRVYTISERKTADAPSIRYYITVLPNAAGYKDLTTFKEDFFTCSGDTGRPVPTLMNEHWLVFVQECQDTAYADLCAEMNQIVTPSIRLQG